MSKKVVWGEGKYSSSARKPGTYKSLNEMLEKGQRLKAEQEKAVQYLQKAMVPMLTLLELRLKKGMPLIVMRPLTYATSVMNTEDDGDGFYNVRKSNSIGSFVDKNVTIMPGTQLVLKSLDPHLREFIFSDALDREHAISYDSRNLLLTQTDIFETVQEYFEKEENKGE